jgi:hypothetical protein
MADGGFRWKWCTLLFLAGATWGCEPPDNALLHGCAHRPLDLTSHCYVRAKRLDDIQYASFAANTKNERVRVKVALRLQRGAVAVELPGCVPTQGRGVVRPGQPSVLECDSKVHRNDYTFSISARPLDFPVEGLEGDVSFRAL